MHDTFVVEYLFCQQLLCNMVLNLPSFFMCLSCLTLPPFQSILTALVRVLFTSHTPVLPTLMSAPIYLLYIYPHLNPRSVLFLKRHQLCLKPGQRSLL